MIKNVGWPICCCRVKMCQCWGVARVSCTYYRNLINHTCVSFSRWCVCGFFSLPVLPCLLGQLFIVCMCMLWYYATVEMRALRIIKLCFHVLFNTRDGFSDESLVKTPHDFRRHTKSTITTATMKLQLAVGLSPRAARTTILIYLFSVVVSSGLWISFLLRLSEKINKCTWIFRRIEIIRRMYGRCGLWREQKKLIFLSHRFRRVSTTISTHTLTFTLHSRDK